LKAGAVMFQQRDWQSYTLLKLEPYKIFFKKCPLVLSISSTSFSELCTYG